ncbi:MAG: tetratricopeptide repeat protein [Baekduia sp.]
MTTNRLASLAALLVAAAAAFLPIARELGAGRWPIVAALLTGALASGAHKILKQRVTRQSELARSAAERVAAEAHLDDAALKCLRSRPTPFEAAELFDDLGVSWSALASTASDGEVPYVPRQADERVIAALRAHDFVVVAGPSKSGKSRTTAEIGRRLHPDSLVLVPVRPGRDPLALARLSEIGQRLSSSASSVVLWLDDIDAFLRTGALNPSTLRRLRSWPCDVRILGTIRERELATFVDRVEAHGDDLEAAEEARETLERAQIVRIAGRLTSDELVAARAAYPTLNLDHELGVHMISGPRLTQRLRAGEEACPEGLAVASAIIDWKRTGNITNIDDATLARAFRPYLDALRPRVAITDADLERGIQWACQEVAPSIALAFKSADGKTFMPFDYVLAYFDGEVGDSQGKRSIPEYTWRAVLDEVSPDEATSVGWSAGHRGRFDLAQEAFEKALAATDLEVADRAQLELGHAFRRAGDAAKSSDNYMLATQRDTPEVQAAGYYSLALNAVEDNDEIAAEELYRKALAAAPESSSAARSAVNLGLILRRRAVGGRRARGGASVILRRPRGELPSVAKTLEAEAESLFQAAMVSGTPDAQRHGANALGVMMAAYGRIDDAIAAYRQAMASGDLNARANLARILIKRHKFDEAQQLINHLCDNGPPWARARGLILMSELAFARGDAGQVEDFLRQATLVANATDDASDARMQLAAFLEPKPDRRAEATEILESVWKDDLGYSSFEAADRLADIYSDVGQHKEAVLWRARAAESEDFEQVSMATFMLARDHRLGGSPTEAEETFRRVLRDWPDSNAAAKAAVNLSLLLRSRLPHAVDRRGSVGFRAAGPEDEDARSINDEAELLLSKAILSGDAEARENGAIALAVLLAERDRLAEAETILMQASEGGSLRASVQLAYVLRLQQRAGEARERLLALRRIDLPDDIRQRVDQLLGDDDG